MGNCRNINHHIEAATSVPDNKVIHRRISRLVIELFLFRQRQQHIATNKQMNIIKYN